MLERIKQKMVMDINPYRELDASINPTDFELFCMDVLKAYAEKEYLQNFTIKHNQKIKSDDGTYQIDILAEYTALGSKNIVLVECKKYTRSIKRDIVATLHTKLQSLGAQKGIIISTTGYQSGATKYANKHGIALWQVFDNHIKHYSSSADNHISDAMKFQLEIERRLPKFFVWGWDCSKDYPYEQIYPTEGMLKEARNKAKEMWISENQ